MSRPHSLTDELRELAAGYALGVLDPPEAAEFKRLLEGSAPLRNEVDAFHEAAADLAHAAPLTHPAARVKEALMQRIAPPAPAPAKFTRLLARANEGRWIQTPFPGVQIKRLFKDPVTGMITTLLKAAAGATYPAHQHGGIEQIYVIDGGLVFDDHALDTGDYEVSAGESHYSAIHSPEGCLALIIHSPHDKIFPA